MALAVLSTLGMASQAAAQFSPQFANSLSYLYTHRIEIEILGITVFEQDLLNENPETANLDQNAIVDYAHAALLDGMAARPSNPHYADLVAAWNHNWNEVNTVLNNVDAGVFDLLVYEVTYWDVIDRNRIHRAATGLVTLGEPAGIAALQLLGEELGLTIDPTRFDQRMAPYLGSSGDADDDGVCNASEYELQPKNYGGFGTFVSNALNSGAVNSAGACNNEAEWNGGAQPGCPTLATIDAQGQAMYAAQGWDWATSDIDNNGMIDSWEVTLAAQVLCNPADPLYQLARNKHTGNHIRIQLDPKSGQLMPWVQALAALAATSRSLADRLDQHFGLRWTNHPLTVNDAAVFSGTQDYDDDTLSAFDEYTRVVDSGGTRDMYLELLLAPLPSGVDRCVGQCAGNCAGSPYPCIDFEAKMRAVDTALDPFRDQLGGYTFAPGIADINGGFNLDTEEIFPNGILDIDEFALINYFFANPDTNLSAIGGPTSAQVHAAYTQNLNRFNIDLGGAGGLINVVAPDLKYILAAYMLIGDDDSVAIPVTAMTEAAGVTELPLGVQIPNLANYVRRPEWFAYSADPDGDGASNIEEYECFRSRSQCCYILAALNAETFPVEGECGAGAGGVIKEEEENSGPYPAFCPAVALLDGEGDVLYSALGLDWLNSDADANGMIDSFEAALVAELLCGDHPAKSLARKKFTANYWRVIHDLKLAELWGYRNALAGLAAANPALGEVLQLQLAFGTSLPGATLDDELLLAPEYDLDGDGFTNGEEYDWVKHLGREAVVEAVFDAGVFPPDYGDESNFGEFPETCPVLGTYDQQGRNLYVIYALDWNATDADNNGLIDSWEVALLADILCNPDHPLYQALRERFTANVYRFQGDPAYAQLAAWHQIIPALMTVSDSLGDYWRTKLLLRTTFLGFKSNEVLVLDGAADLDDDGATNLQEFNNVRNRGGTRDEYVAAVQDPTTQGGLDGEGEGEGEELSPFCNVPLCTDTCDGEPVDSGFEDAYRSLIASLGLLLGEDAPASADEADLDENGILDVAHARLLDTLLANPGAASHCCVRAAYEANLAGAVAVMDQFVVHPLWPVLTALAGGPVAARNTLERSIAGLMTIGEEGTQALLADAINGADLDPPLPEIDLSVFDRSAELYLAWNGDVDLDEVCNFGEYNTYIAGETGVDDFVAAALDPSDAVDGGGCEDCTIPLPCEAPPCLASCDETGVASGFEDAYRSLISSLGLLLGEDAPESADDADLDENGVLDVAHARLLDTLLSDASVASHCCVRAAYEENLAASVALMDQFVVHPLWPVLTALAGGPVAARNTLERSIAGLMTIGEEATQALLADAINNAELDPPLPTVDLSVFNRSAEVYLAWYGDADLDGVCNAGEYSLHIAGEGGIDAFVSAALDAQQIGDGGGCPPCGGEEGEVEGEGEGGVEGEVGEGEGEGEGQEGEGEGDGEGVVEGEVDGEVGEGEGEGDVEPFVPHSVDQNGDGVVNISELLRLIQFYNSDGFHCDETGEDGYSPGLDGDKLCAPHASDYNPQDWQILLTELLRTIQFFNAGAYHPCGSGEDGYCAGLAI